MTTAPRHETRGRAKEPTQYRDVHAVTPRWCAKWCALRAARRLDDRRTGDAPRRARGLPPSPGLSECGRCPSDIFSSTEVVPVTPPSTGLSWQRRVLFGRGYHGRNPGANGLHGHLDGRNLDAEGGLRRHRLRTLPAPFAPNPRSASTARAAAGSVPPIRVAGTATTIAARSTRMAPPPAAPSALVPPAPR